MATMICVAGIILVVIGLRTDKDGLCRWGFAVGLFGFGMLMGLVAAFGCK